VSKGFAVKVFSKDDKSDDRIKWILKQLKINRKIKTIEIVSFFNITKETATKDLKKLLKDKLIIRKGSKPKI